MKKIFMGIIWFIVFYLVICTVAGVIIGSRAPEELKIKGFKEGYNYQPAEEFSKKYGGLILLSALILSIIGTASGILPGTKKRSDDSGNII